jgi:predicted dehydrogenase
MGWTDISKPAEREAVMLKVGIVGCGKIADAHASQIQRIKGCEIVGVCDREPLMARQLCERFQIKDHFADLSELLCTAEPDVVHITTPPQSHFALAKQCLESGHHVYVEKPFTLDESEAQRLIRLASERDLKITVGHDDQFSHVARRMRSLVASGFLGAGPVHMESHYCYELGGAYAEALVNDKDHWVRKLPGKLLQNIISHGIARIAEFITGDSPAVQAFGFVSPFFKRMGETEIVDELRVIIAEETGTTAYFTFSSQIRPDLHQFRIYGTKNGLLLDQDQEMLIRFRGNRYKSYAEKFIPEVQLAHQCAGNLITNMRSFMARDFQMKSGMKYLIEGFYRSIVEGASEPIPYREILLTARIMDRIFAQLDAQRMQQDRPIQMLQAPQTTR